MTYSVFAGAGQWRAAADDSRIQGLFGLDAAAGNRHPRHDGLPMVVELRYLAVRPDGVEGVGDVYALACA